eukprot:768003-Hanusia_phi.AAC.3
MKLGPTSTAHMTRSTCSLLFLLSPTCQKSTSKEFAAMTNSWPSLDALTSATSPAMPSWIFVQPPATRETSRRKLIARTLLQVEVKDTHVPIPQQEVGR